MNNREKFIESLQAGKFENGYKKGEVTDTERMKNAIEDYSIYQEKKELELYKHFMNSSSYDEIKKVQVPSYRGDEER